MSSSIASRPAFVPSDPERIGLHGSRHDTRFRYNWPAAFRAAVLSTAAITLYMLTVPRMFGFEEMDIGITVGQISAPDGGVPAYLMRVCWHVGNGLAYVFLYAYVLLYLRKQSSVLTGAIFGIFLWSAGPMFLIPLLLDQFPNVANGQLTNPGILMLDLKLGLLPAVVDLGAHLIHGTIAGAIYKHRTD